MINNFSVKDNQKTELNSCHGENQPIKFFNFSFFNKPMCLANLIALMQIRSSKTPRSPLRIFITNQDSQNTSSDEDRSSNDVLILTYLTASIELDCLVSS